MIWPLGLCEEPASGQIGKVTEDGPDKPQCAFVLTTLDVADEDNRRGQRPILHCLRSETR
jgi:hypothetical protein